MVSKPVDQRFQKVLDIFQVLCAKPVKLFVADFMVKMNHPIAIARDLSKEDSMLIGEDPLLGETGANFFVFGNGNGKSLGQYVPSQIQQRLNAPAKV